MKIFKSEFLKRIVLLICFIVVASCLAILFWNTNNTNKTKESLDKINNTKLTLADVMGTNLPSTPNKDLNDFTVAGFDVNNNGIRDDVELAIFEKYPNSAKIRSGMLQYAQALQLELTEMVDEETLKAVMQKRSNARACIDNAGPEISLQTEQKIANEAFALTDSRKKEVENYVLNTELRSKKQTEVFEKYMTTYSISSEKDCDIGLSTLPN